MLKFKLAFTAGKAARRVRAGGLITDSTKMAPTYDNVEADDAADGDDDKARRGIDHDDTSLRVMGFGIVILIIVSIGLVAVVIGRATDPYTDEARNFTPTKGLWNELLKAYPIEHGSAKKTSIHKCPEEGEGQCYGEPTAHGLRQLLHHWPSACALTKESVLYDIGSGFGRLATFLKIHANASQQLRVRGIEINACRDAAAQELLQFVKAREPGVGDSLSFRRGDVKELGFAEGTHAFMSSQCWTESLLVDVLTMARDKAPKVQCLVVFQGFRFLDTTDAVAKAADSFGHVVNVVPIDTTWGGATATFIRRGQCPAAADIAPGPPGSKRSKLGDKCWEFQESAGLMAAAGQEAITGRGHHGP